MSARKVSSASKGGKWIVWTVCLVLLLFLTVLGSILVIRYSIAYGVTTAKETFIETYTNTRKETYKHFYELVFGISEKEHHVHNDVTINVKDIKEKSELEVLYVSDVVYIIEDEADTPSGTATWLKVPGTGVFTVNLAASEFIIDNGRSHILVRSPKPAFDSESISIDLNNVERLYFSQKWNSENTAKTGESLAREHLSEASSLIQEDFEAEEQYFIMAKSSAESMIRALLKGLNPDVPDLQVDVEFF